MIRGYGLSILHYLCAHLDAVYDIMSRTYTVQNVLKCMKIILLLCRRV